MLCHSLNFRSPIEPQKTNCSFREMKFDAIFPLIARKAPIPAFSPNR